MIRATTATHQFTFPESCDSYDIILITYSQKGNIVLELNKDNLDKNGNVATYELSQDETLMFDADITVKVQVRVKKGGKAYASNIFEFSVSDVLNSTII